MTDNNQITVHFGPPSPEDLEAIWKGELPREQQNNNKENE